MTVSSIQLVPPGPGRRFHARRTIRLGDVLPSGAVRLDSLARYLQDVAGDDGQNAGIDPDLGWLTRKSVIEVVRRPRLNEPIELVTWASGSGGRWAERRTTISSGGQVNVEAAGLWVCVDGATLRPARLSERFWQMYGEAVGDRVVSSRLTHTEPSPEVLAGARNWPLRLADLDVFDHVNNASTWAAMEDEIDRVAPGAPVRRVELEYRAPVGRAQAVGLASQVHGSLIKVWLVGEGAVLASAHAWLTPDRGGAETVTDDSDR